MPKLKRDYLVTKSNVLNEMRSKNMTLQELRLFSIYLSKINPLDISTRVVRFSLSDYQSIMEFNPKNIPHLKESAQNLLSKVVDIPKQNGGFTLFHLFSVFELDTDENGEWYIQINAHDKALELLFEYQKKFFKYRLWNALQLKSKNQLRMYEIMKQYEYIGRREITIKDLKGMMGIEEHEYPQYKIFRRDVLEVCRKSLDENTDISITYEPCKKLGRGGKVIALRFTIVKNKSYKDKLGLEQFIDLNRNDAIDTVATDIKPFSLNNVTPDEAAELVDEGKITLRDEVIINLRDIMYNDFSFEQTRELFNIAVVELPHIRDNALIHHFQAKYDYVKRLESQEKIDKSSFSYLKSIIGKL